MPTYEYKCDACGHAFEKFQTMSAEPVKVCPSCGKEQVRRLIGIGAGMIFKGSGFYITDYRDAAYKDKAKADAAPATGDAAKPAEAGKSAEPSKSGEATKETKAPAASAPASTSATPSTAAPAAKPSTAATSKSHD